MAAADAVQNDATILSGPRQRWVFAEAHPHQAESLASAARIPTILAELLISRGIFTAGDASRFLAPEIAHLHDPLLMLGMSTAVERVEAAIDRQEPILLYGDYDVDGTTAIVLLKTTIEMLGGMVRFHVPHRLREGYGLQSSVLEAAYADGVRLVITVDTGMRAVAEAETARRIGLDLVITDHHLAAADEALPDALAILNPNQKGCRYPEKSLCGSSIALKLAQALLERHDQERARTKLLPSFLKMAALATIADAVPLRGENRVIAGLGLRELRRPVSAGLRALFAAAQLDPASKPLTGFDIAFRVAPRINAAGRMDVASDIIELFSTRDPARANELAGKLERLNRDRRDTEAAAIAGIETRLATDPELRDARMIVIDGDGWHRGIIGILASRVVERTARPSLIISVEEGIAHGSGRSVPGFQLLSAIETCSDLFTRFGGHAYAVGFTLPASSLPELKRRLGECARERLPAEEPERVLSIHAELPLHQITAPLAAWLRRLEPLGHSNPEPIFAARNVRSLAAPRVMKERHIRLELAENGRSAATRAVGWDMAARAAELGITQGSLIDIAYRIRENPHPDFGGLEVEIAGLRLAGT